MKNGRKKIHSAESKLIGALSSHFASLDPKEAKDRIEKLREFVSAELDDDGAQVVSTQTESHAKLGSPDHIAPFRLYWRLA